MDKLVIGAALLCSAVAKGKLYICEVDTVPVAIDNYGILADGCSNFCQKMELVISGHSCSAH